MSLQDFLYNISVHLLRVYQVDFQALLCMWISYNILFVFVVDSVKKREEVKSTDVSIIDMKLWKKEKRRQPEIAIFSLLLFFFT